MIATRLADTRPPRPGRWRWPGGGQSQVAVREVDACDIHAVRRSAAHSIACDCVAGPMVATILVFLAGKGVADFMPLFYRRMKRKGTTWKDRHVSGMIAADHNDLFVIEVNDWMNHTMPLLPRKQSSLPTSCSSRPRCAACSAASMPW